MSEPVRPDFVQGLTPLRGIAAIIVVFYHYNIFVAEIVPADRFPIVDRLALMVDFFFILSGFIMCHNYGAWFKQGISAHAFRSYLGARFARLYPLHLATFAAILAIGSLAVAHDWTPNLQYFFDYHGVVPQLLMAQAWGYPHEATWNTPAWSISIEFLLYLIFPLLILGLARTGWIGRAVFVAILAVSAALVIYRFEPAFWRERYRLMHVPDFVPYPTKTFEVITGPGAMLRGLYSFGIGLLLHDLWESRWAERMLCSAVLPLAISIGLVVLWSFKLIADPVAVLLLAVIILSVACRASLVGRALEMQPFRWLGDVSYAIYLVHMIPILGYMVWRGATFRPDPLLSETGLSYALPPGQAWFGLVLLYGVTLLLAAAANRMIETPARAWLRHAFGLGGHHSATAQIRTTATA